MPSVYQWFRECNQGNKDSCRKLLNILYLIPMVTKELKKLLGPVAIVPIPKPWPGPDPPLLDPNFLQAGDVIRFAMGERNPQPSFVSRAEQLQGATDLRAAMERVIKELDGEIKRLKTLDPGNQG